MKWSRRGDGKRSSDFGSGEIISGVEEGDGQRSYDSGGLLDGSLDVTLE